MQRLLMLGCSGLLLHTGGREAARARPVRIGVILQQAFNARPKCSASQWCNSRRGTPDAAALAASVEQICYIHPDPRKRPGASVTAPASRGLDYLYLSERSIRMAPHAQIARDPVNHGHFLPRDQLL